MITGIHLLVVICLLRESQNTKVPKKEGVKNKDTRDSMVPHIGRRILPQIIVYH